mmetsp:Transcript_4888/g.10496  ORF Transcript_4888/g.10496 Transcript_4888/m.10496 type:complete len:417 (+) Transcript_4888:76-1326(+)
MPRRVEDRKLPVDDQSENQRKSSRTLNQKHKTKSSYAFDQYQLQQQREAQVGVSKDSAGSPRQVNHQKPSQQGLIRSSSSLLALNSWPERAAEQNSVAVQSPENGTHHVVESATCDTAPHKWERVLWKRQPYSDNYTDATFLRELVVNASVPTRHYWAVVLDSAAITQQMSVVVAAVAVPSHLLNGSLPAQVVLVACAVLLLTGYAVCALLGGHILGGSLAHGVRQCSLLVGGVFFLSPLLHTLTRTVSADTIIALTVLLLLGHLVLHDYNFVNSVTDRLSGTLSLGAAVFAAVLLSSLMASELDVFAQVLFSLEAFLLSPFARHYIRGASTTAHIVTTLLLLAGALVLLAPLSTPLAALFVGAVICVTFLCPLWLVSIHKFKAQINGPWDEAVPHIPREVMLAAAAGPVAAAGAK